MMSRQPHILMPEVARRAGVGQATLYRHFPDRYALTAAVVAHHLERLEACIATTVDQPAAFRHLLRDLFRTQIAMRPLVLFVRRFDPDTRDRYQQRVFDALSTPLRHAQEHGYVRGDLVPGDLALLFTMVEAVAEATGEVSAARAADRSIDLVLDGVFTVTPPRGAGA